MPLYGDIAHVKKMLRPTEGTDLGADETSAYRWAYG